MTTARLEKEILFYLKSLPNSALQEVVDFVQFLSLKKKIKNFDNLTKELSNLDNFQNFMIDLFLLLPLTPVHL